jgi:thiol-disulfide isomerase/thioredoxin
MARRGLLSVALLATLPLGAQQCQSDSEGYPEAPSDVRDAIIAAMGSAPRQLGDERVAEARKVRDRFPSDYLAHRFYQHTSYYSGGYRPFFPRAIREEYRNLLETHPDDLMYLMLYARTLVGANTPEAIRLLDNIVTRDPNYRLARLELVEIYSSPTFRDNAKLAANADAYWKVCPDSISVYSNAAKVEDPEFNARAAARLRKLLKGRNDNAALGLYGTLWNMEFKTVPLSEQAPVRDRIRKDVEFLRSLDSTYGANLPALAGAYRLLSDAEGTKWVETENAKNLDRIHRSRAASEAIREWHRANPSKTGIDLEAYQEKLVKQSEEWIHEWPDDPEPRYERFQALQAMWDAPLEETVKTAEDWIRTYERQAEDRKASRAFRDTVPSFNPPYVQVSQYFSKHNVRFAELADLLEKAVTETLRWLAAPVSDLYSVDVQSADRLRDLSTLNSLAEGFLKIKKYGRAHELLAQIGPELLERKPPKSIEALYWNNMSRLAQVEGNKPAYLEYERSAVLANSTYNPPPPQQDLIDNLRKAWKEVKGSDAGFDAWFGNPIPNSAPSVAATSSGWTKLDKPMPDFRLADANGKTWQLADLKGKVTLVNVWATWCIPCREELPYLQKLFDKVHGRKDLAVITLNTDENPGMLGQFLRENKYTFPVLPASGYVSNLVPTIPSNWIVDKKGVLRLERVGFSDGSDQWVADTIAGMEKAR